ncbi:zinc finger, SWIM-type [Artemisia annua]|uniref:Zinc finger, SWIM-type n=1 Tax=Artemisia annua TaxID=35608 RepID=A0A2U1KGL7_ARTAN|nr:zinc finger, SWIM-type [Artemisia annua]
MVISAPKWKFRNTEEDVDPWKRYGRKYVNGDFSFFDDVDIDEFSVLEVIDMVEMVGYSKNVKSNYHFKIPDGDLDTGLHALGNDHDVRKLSNYIEQENTRKVVKGSCAKKLLLGCQDEVDVGQSSHHGESSHPVTESMGQPSAFANDFYSASDPFLGVDDFDPFYGLDNIEISDKRPAEPCIGKGKSKVVDEDVPPEEEEEGISDNEDGQDDGNDTDDLVDVENTVDDVIVNMDNFDKTNAKIMGEKEPPNLSECIANEERELALHVVDNDEFESASDEDERQRKLKHFRKQNKSKDSGVHKYYFYVCQQFGSADEVKQRVHLHSIETMRELYFKKNDKLRVRAQCRGTIPQFHDEGDGPSKVIGPSEANEPNKKQPWTKSKVSQSRGHECSPRSQAKVVGGKPKLRKFADNECTWALQVSKLPDSQTWQVKSYDDEHRLDTWRTVYSHLINPIHSKILWPKSDIPSTIIPPNYHPHIGRSPKKRKMSLGESIPLVHDGKLSRKGKTVTCVLCKGKGHNKRTCTGVRNVASGSTNVGNNKRKSTNGPSGSTTVGNKKNKSTNAPSGSNVAANKTQASANVQPGSTVAAKNSKRSSNAATPSVPATKKKIPTKRKSATQPTAKASKLY